MNGLDLAYIAAIVVLAVEILTLRARVRRVEQSVKLNMNARYGAFMQAHPKGPNDALFPKG